MDFRELGTLADTVATEIRGAFQAHTGSKWQNVDGQEKAVSFDIEAPALRGQNIRELNPDGLGYTGNFNSRLRSAGGTHVNGHLSGQTLHSVHFDPEIVGDEYTGKVTVRDRSGAFDYDL
ncbi:MAG: hypothetical protein V4611_00630 [Patescibacteria group bacterium]